MDESNRHLDYATRKTNTDKAFPGARNPLFERIETHPPLSYLHTKVPLFSLDFANVKAKMLLFRRVDIITTKQPGTESGVSPTFLRL